MNVYITPEDYERAAKIGVSERLLNARVRQNNWSKERAITTPVKKQQDRRAMAKLAAKNGIGYGTFMSRMSNLKMTPYEAATKPLMTRSEIAKMEKKYPKEIVELRKKNGIKYHTFISRVNIYGWDVYEAATKPVNSKFSGWRKVREKYK